MYRIMLFFQQFNWSIEQIFMSSPAKFKCFKGYTVKHGFLLVFCLTSSYVEFKNKTICLHVTLIFAGIFNFDLFVLNSYRIKKLITTRWKGG